MGLRVTLPNHIPAYRSELKLSIMKSFSIVETVKEASAVCRSFLDGVRKGYLCIKTDTC